SHSFLAQQRRQCRSEIAGGEAAQVENRHGFFQAWRFAHVGWQNVAAELLTRTPVMHPWRLHLQLAGAALNGPLPGATVAHHQRVSLLVPLASVAANVFVYFSL